MFVTSDTSCGMGLLPVNVTGNGTGSANTEFPVSVASIVFLSSGGTWFFCGLKGMSERIRSI